jgi:exopolyphosphatase / guanosine-5'-triphosphate,3'-diphosphate pyrophosphatase
VPPSPCVAVIDLGSNSIKILVAARDARGRLTTLLSKSIDARISAGISADQPRLSEQGMTRGLLAMQELLAIAEPYAPQQAIVVATSAVRDAANGAEFREQILRATGFEVRILSGAEEAAAIGDGLLCDPELSELENFHVFDLGGGSLECLAFRNRRPEQSVSLPLGCVRLMEKFVTDPAAPFSDKERKAVMQHVQDVIVRNRFMFNLPSAAGIATGGTMSTVRAIIGARTGQKAEDSPPLATVDALRDMLDQLAPLTLEQRRKVPGLPPPRADVFPTALATLIAIAEYGELPVLRHSFYNLRYGLAAQLLASIS